MSKKDSIRIWKNYQRTFHEIIPNAIKTKTPSTFYWPSSPENGWGKKESLTQGDVHYWGVWWGNENYLKYKEKIGRFVSEYGFQSYPDVNDLTLFTSEINWNENNAEFKNHQKHPKGFEYINQAIKENFYPPKNIQEKIYLSQLHQQMAMKTAAEAHRSAQPYCMGSLYWQMNDCWPAVSWSTISFSGEWKNAQYQFKRSFNPVYITFKENKTTLEVHVLNERNELLNDTLIIELRNLNSEIVQKWNREIHALPAENILGYNLPDSVLKLLNNNDLFIYAKLKNETFNDSHEKIHNFYFAKKINEYAFLKPEIKYQIIGDECIIESNTLIIGLKIRSKVGNRIYSDNAFHLLPGIKKKIKVTKGIPFTPGEEIKWEYYGY